MGWKIQYLDLSLGKTITNKNRVNPLSLDTERAVKVIV